MGVAWNSLLSLQSLKQQFSTLVAWWHAVHQNVSTVSRPGGLQLGQLMMQSGRDYVIIEKAPTAGSFFDKYPRM
jgi:hypothetical protein